MINEYKVSVIIPAYNIEKFLKKCVESVLSQTLKPIEIICINDGSRDGSLDILRDLEKENDNILVIDQVNQGVSVARNNGIESASGEYVFFLDGDDYLDKHFFEYFYNNAKNNNSDLVILNSFWNLASRVTSKYHSALPTCSMFIRRSILFYYPFIRYPLDVHPGEDGIFSHMLLMYTKKVTHEDKVIYHYVKHDAQDHIKSLENPHRFIKSSKKWIDILESFYNEHDLYNKHSLSFLKYIEAECFLFFRTKSFNVDDETEVFDIIKKISNKLTLYIFKYDYKYFSSEFITLLDMSSIKEYYKKVKYRYNYLRFRLLGQNVAIRYKENRLKYYK